MIIIWNPFGTVRYLCMVRTLPGKQEKARNLKIKFKAMKKPGIVLCLVNFHEKQYNNHEKSNISLKKIEEKGEA